MRLAPVLLSVLVASGCSSQVHIVDEQYRPLEKVAETAIPRGSWLTTVGKTCYVNDLDEWLERNPPGSISYHGTLIHEREHTVRQLAYGLSAWIGRYLSDRAFMWAEEAIAWYIELRYYIQRGMRIDVEGVARSLSNYKNATGSMINYDDALRWVQDVVAGRWKPSEED